MFLFVSVFEEPFDECLKGFETPSSFFGKRGLIVMLGSVCHRSANKRKESGGMSTSFRALGYFMVYHF